MHNFSLRSLKIAQLFTPNAQIFTPFCTNFHSILSIIDLWISLLCRGDKVILNIHNFAATRFARCVVRCCRQGDAPHRFGEKKLDIRKGDITAALLCFNRFKVIEFFWVEDITKPIFSTSLTRRQISIELFNFVD